MCDIGTTDDTANMPKNEPERSVWMVLVTGTDQRLRSGLGCARISPHDTPKGCSC